MKTEADIARAIRDADGPLRITGGGTRGIADAVRGTGLSVAGVAGIELYEPGALTLVARAGTPMAEIDATLSAQRQRLAFEPPDLRALLGTCGTPTIGGAIATNASGPRRVVAGAARDFMLGVRFVDGMGTIVKNGGRVMKNVTGYDLVKLMSGSHGTLGVLTEVALKVLPVAETEATVMLHGLDAAQAVAASAAALGSPFEVSGAAFVPVAGGASVALLRIEGFAASVDYRCAQLSSLLGHFGEIEVAQASTSATLWRDVRDVACLTGAPGDLWRISVKPSDAPGILAALPDGARTCLDWGGGRIWAVVPEGTDLRGPMQVPGHATLLRGAGVAFPPEPAPLAALAAGLRAKFDPRGILNPGLMG